MIAASRRTSHRVTLVACAVMAALATIAAQGPMTPAQAREQLQRAERLYADARYDAAYDAYRHGLDANDHALATLARKGLIRSALRLARFEIARRQAETLAQSSAADVDAITLYADALWGSGLFDEAEQEYQHALSRDPGSSRARYGAARSLASRGHVEDALATITAAVAAAPRDVDLLAFLAETNERLYRYDEAIRTYERCIALLPSRLRNDSNVAVSKVKLLRSFAGHPPVTIADQTALHTVPFRLVNKKILLEATVNGRKTEMVLDTGAERTTLSGAVADRAGVRRTSETILTGIGTPGVRRLTVGRVDTLEIGTLAVRNIPVSIRSGNLPGVPVWQNESFSPVAIGLSVIIDYASHQVTLGRQIPDAAADFRLPLRLHRLPMVRGVLNASYPGYFVVDTGGEMLSISTEMAGRIGGVSGRRIALRVWGVTGLDPDAFLLPGVDLTFNDIAYHQFGVAVLNLRGPSVLLGFEVGGVLGHAFLAPYRVALDVANGELRLSKS